MSGSHMATGVPDALCKEDEGRVEELTHVLNTVDSVVCVMITTARDHRRDATRHNQQWV
jgi:hypothetical protein